MSRLVRWLVPLVSLAVVLGLTLWDLSRSKAAPGPVHPAHARIAELDQGANCDKCHRDGAVAAALCVACHRAIGEQHARGVGLHAAVLAEGQTRCESCHPEHAGDSAPLLPQHAFQKVGLADRSTYDHRHVEFSLAGVHTRLPCSACHEHADAVDPPSGGRFFGLSQQCTACHEDAHAGAFGGDCASCHGQDEHWPDAPGFEHDRFALTGAHRQVACAKCHEEGSPRSVEAEAQAQQPVRTCADCHADPHGGSGAALASLQLTDTADCSRCHDANAWADARPTPEQHAELGFALRGPHAAADCAGCHGDAMQAARWTGAAPRVAQCAACHEHPHQEALVATATASGEARGCADCHLDADASFAEGRISPEQHQATGFALTVPHADVACNKCHQGEVREQRFPGRQPEDCRVCHRDVHDRQFVDGDQVRQCTACHDAHTFVPHRFDAQMHAAVYALTGAHDAVACVACHRQVVDGVRRFVGVARECAACHKDVHNGQFDRRGLPAEIDGRRGCARCHGTSSFTELVAPFAHKQCTGFELQGAHASVACADCHTQPRAQHLGRAPGRRCADCHDDPHLGQFALAGTTDCARCHGEQSFHALRFDHQRDSRFALDERHRKLACADCHKSYQVAGGEVVRYRPLGTRCGDCHQLGRPKGGGR